MAHDPDQLGIRPGTPQDVCAVEALLLRAYPALLKHDYPTGVMAAVLPVITKAQTDLVACGSYFLAERAGDLLAAGGWTSHTPGGRSGPAHIGHVRHVVTDDRHVRKGIGRALMAHVMDHARAAGVTDLHCQSTLTAVPFYRVLGFAPVAPVEVRLRSGDLFPAVHMLAHLPGA